MPTFSSDKELIEQAKQKGNIALSPGAGSETEIQLAFTNYVKQGDKMAIVLDKAQKTIVSVSILLRAYSRRSGRR